MINARQLFQQHYFLFGLRELVGSDRHVIWSVNVYSQVFPSDYIPPLHPLNGSSNFPETTSNTWKQELGQVTLKAWNRARTKSFKNRKSVFRYKRSKSTPLHFFIIQYHSLTHVSTWNHSLILVTTGKKHSGPRMHMKTTLTLTFTFKPFFDHCVSMKTTLGLASTLQTLFYPCVHMKNHNLTTLWPLWVPTWATNLWPLTRKKTLWPLSPQEKTIVDLCVNKKNTLWPLRLQEKHSLTLSSSWKITLWPLVSPYEKLPFDLVSTWTLN